jgi:hypothetical protein
MSKKPQQFNENQLGTIINALDNSYELTRNNDTKSSKKFENLKLIVIEMRNDLIAQRKAKEAADAEYEKEKAERPERLRQLKIQEKEAFLRSYHPDMVAIWNIYTPSQNFDLAGSHSNNFNSTFQGTWESAVDKAFEICGGMLGLPVIELVPVVGMGGTMHIGSDEEPFTVIEVISKFELKVQIDKCTRTDSNGMDECQMYTYEPNLAGDIYTITLRPNGKWIQQAKSPKGSPHFSLGIRRKYFDYSF